MTTSVALKRRNKIVKRRKKSGLIALIVLAVIAWVMFGFNYSNADFANYESAYIEIGNGGTNDYLEIGFVWLIKVFNFLHFSYQAFLIAISAISILILVISVTRLTSNPAIALLFFLIYPFVYDVVQYRNLLAYIFVLYALRFLIKKRVRLNDIFYYLIFVAIGMLFHKSVIVYALFIFVAIKDMKVFLTVVVSLFLIVLFFIWKNQFFVTILNNLNLDRLARYDFDNTFSTFLQYFAVYIFFMFLAVLKFGTKNRSNKFKLLILVSVTIPFIVMNGTSARFFRNMFIVFYAFLLDTKGRRITRIRSMDLFIHVALLSSIVFVAYVQLSSGIYYELVLYPVLHNNMIFGKLFYA